MWNEGLIRMKMSRHKWDREAELICCSLTAWRHLHTLDSFINKLTYSAPYACPIYLQAVCGYILSIICSCCFIGLYLIGAHMAKQHGIGFPYSLPLFPAFPSDNIQHNHTRYWTGHAFSHSTMFFWLPSEAIWSTAFHLQMLRAHYAFIGKWKHF